MLLLLAKHIETPTDRREQQKKKSWRKGREMNSNKHRNLVNSRDIIKSSCPVTSPVVTDDIKACTNRKLVLLLILLALMVVSCTSAELAPPTPQGTVQDHGKEVIEDTEEPTDTPSPTETATAVVPTPTEEPAIKSAINENLTHIPQADESEADIRNGANLDKDLLRQLSEETADINHVEEKKVQFFTMHERQSSGLLIISTEEKNNQKTDVIGEIIAAPSLITFEAEEGSRDLALVPEKSNMGYAVYTDGNLEFVLPLQFSLIGASLNDRRLVGAVPYTVKEENGIRLALITETDEGDLDLILGFDGLPNVLNEINRMADNEQIVRDENGNLVIQNEQGEGTRSYNSDTGQWEIITRVTEIAGEEVDFYQSLTGQTNEGIQYQVNFGIDFHESYYDVYPISRLEIHDQELMGKFVLWNHFINWVESQALEATMSIGQWRARYQSTNGAWRRADEDVMRRLVSNFRNASRKHSFEEYLNLVENGQGHYFIFAEGEESGEEDFYQVDPLAPFTFIRKEHSRSGDGIRTGRENRIAAKVGTEGNLTGVFSANFGPYTEQLRQAQTKLVSLLDDPEIENSYSAEEISQMKKQVKIGTRSLFLINVVMRAFCSPPTFTDLNVGGPIQSLPAGRAFMEICQQRTQQSNKSAYHRAFGLAYLLLEGESDRILYALTVHLR